MKEQCQAKVKKIQNEGLAYGIKAVVKLALAIPRKSLRSSAHKLISKEYRRPAHFLDFIIFSLFIRAGL